MKVADGTQMHAIDKMAIEKYGIPGIVLMENASKAVSLKCIEILNEIKGRTAVAVCGSGNNGGDGFAVARMLYCYGIKISVIFIGEEKKLTILNRLKKSALIFVRILIVLKNVLMKPI